MSSPSTLLLFTRYPEPGKTKTRLIPAIGPYEAAQLQKRLTEYIFTQAKELENIYDCNTALHYSGCTHEQLCEWLGQVDGYKQTDGDLGTKMEYAFKQAFLETTERAILIGSDIPDINAEILHSAFKSLKTHQVVIGPSLDGGYYLIGLTKKWCQELYPLLFRNIKWSTNKVFSITHKRIINSGYRVKKLQPLGDIDTPGDLDLARSRGFL